MGEPSSLELWFFDGFGISPCQINQPLLFPAQLGIQDLPGLHSFAEKSGGFGAGDQLISAAG
jgi:hypothetical protein